MSRRAPATSRGATVSRALAKRCNNTCPICWMPLNVGRGAHAEKWERVQMVFKSKPTFSVKEGCTDHSRAVHVFGLNDFTGSKTTNYEACHFLHHSAVGDNQTFSQMWGVGIMLQNEFAWDRLRTRDLPVSGRRGREGEGGGRWSKCVQVRAVEAVDHSSLRVLLCQAPGLPS